MSMLMRSKTLLSTVLLGIALNFSPALLAETVEQKIRLELVNPGDSASCQVKALFKGDHDNCKNDNAGGRADCSKDTGCVCTRQEKHITWVMAGKTPFTVTFDQGGDNPFVTNGESACNFKGNKDGKLRCRVKGKDVPRGIYRYSITSQQCAAAKAEIKVY